jgi:hypothetical protein
LENFKALRFWPIVTQGFEILTVEKLGKNGDGFRGFTAAKNLTPDVARI